MARSGGAGGSDVAIFINKLWKIVENPEYSDFISWTDDGKGIVIKQEEQFARNVLPRYFKHNKFYSFVRQLNLYGFHKVLSDQGGLIKDGKESVQFGHTHFRRGHPEDLYLVQRKTASKSVGVSEGGVSNSLVRSDSHHRFSEVMNDIHVMKGRQEGIATVLEVLKQDNSHLRHEVSVLKEKHVRQQKILNKIIHFLVQMVYSKGKIPASRRPNRNNRLMLMDAADDQLVQPSAKKLRLAPSTEEAGLSDYISAAVKFDLDDIANFGEQSTSPDIVTLLPQFNMPTTAAAIMSPPLSTSSSIMDPSVTDSIGPSPFSPDDLISDSPQSVPLSSASSTTNSVVTSSAAPLTSASAALTSTILASSTDFPIPPDVLEEYPIPPAPTSLVPAPHPENRMCLNGQLCHQQVGIDNLQDLIAGNFSLDPSIITEYLTSSDSPEYDYADTARILENLPNLTLPEVGEIIADRN